MKQLIISITDSYYQKAIEQKLDAPTLIVEAIRHGIPLDNAIKEAQVFLDEGDIREFEGNMQSGHHVFDIFIKHIGKEQSE